MWWCGLLFVLSPGVEAGHTLRPLRDLDNHTGRDLCQYTTKGRLAHRENAFKRLYCVSHGEWKELLSVCRLTVISSLCVCILAWWHGSEGSWSYYERVSVWLLSGSHHHRLAGRSLIPPSPSSPLPPFAFLSPPVPFFSFSPLHPFSSPSLLSFPLLPSSPPPSPFSPPLLPLLPSPLPTKLTSYIEVCLWDARCFIYRNKLFYLFCLQARGIDVQQVSLVINYDLPANRENYIHRYCNILDLVPMWGAREWS